MERSVNKRSYTYVLRDGEPVPEPDMAAWGRWFAASNAERVVGLTTFSAGDGVVEVSTVFLGMDHGRAYLGGGGPAILWETMVFGGPLDREQDRYATRAEAEAGHRAMVERVRAALAAEGRAMLAP